MGSAHHAHVAPPPSAVLPNIRSRQSPERRAAQIRRASNCHPERAAVFAAKEGPQSAKLRSLPSPYPSTRILALSDLGCSPRLCVSAVKLGLVFRFRRMTCDLGDSGDPYPSPSRGIPCHPRSSHFGVSLRGIIPNHLRLAETSGSSSMARSLPERP